MAVDPVCGMEVDENSALYVSEYRGKTYYFCSPSCKADFDTSPESYIPHDGDKGRMNPAAPTRPSSI